MDGHLRKSIHEFESSLDTSMQWVRLEEALNRRKRRRIAIVLFFLAGVVAIGILGYNRSEPYSPESINLETPIKKVDVNHAYNDFLESDVDKGDVRKVDKIEEKHRVAANSQITDIHASALKSSSNGSDQRSASGEVNKLDPALGALEGGKNEGSFSDLATENVLQPNETPFLEKNDPPFVDDRRSLFLPEIDMELSMLDWKGNYSLAFEPIKPTKEAKRTSIMINSAVLWPLWNSKGSNFYDPTEENPAYTNATSPLEVITAEVIAIRSAPFGLYWSIGLNWLRKNEKLTYQNTIETETFFAVENQAQSIGDNGQIVNHPGMIRQYNKYNFDVVHYNSSQSLSIPVQLFKEIDFKSVSLLLGAGTRIPVYNKFEGKVVGLDGIITDANLISARFSLPVIASANIEYPLTSSFSIGAGINAAYFRNRHQLSGIQINNSAFAAGLGVNLKYNFLTR